ncbi:hypothetical protein PPERSA_09299 [Pseudocohnilembus persalinus]|uniref:Uncharacterized protein n=1 Tax=Pseudocohnilembus persalinus TaxID=266149 RepID=A0A0V0R558_PSEPJ|nr:hypothetical protein PPERSA_09299 [Pseudocohnilembus persalinus]|eukprot:KRX09629.1 hypothetical protein PPERSA_09299 [Pseudocohnilembus persalinus]
MEQGNRFKENKQFYIYFGVKYYINEYIWNNPNDDYIYMVFTQLFWQYQNRVILIQFHEFLALISFLLYSKFEDDREKCLTYFDENITKIMGQKNLDQVLLQFSNDELKDQINNRLNLIFKQTEISSVMKTGLELIDLNPFYLSKFYDVKIKKLIIPEDFFLINENYEKNFKNSILYQNFQTDIKNLNYNNNDIQMGQIDSILEYSSSAQKSYLEFYKLLSENYQDFKTLKLCISQEQIFFCDQKIQNPVYLENQNKTKKYLIQWQYKEILKINLEQNNQYNQVRLTVYPYINIIIECNCALQVIDQIIINKKIQQENCENCINYNKVENQINNNNQNIQNNLIFDRKFLLEDLENLNFKDFKSKNGYSKGYYDQNLKNMDQNYYSFLKKRNTNKFYIQK